VKIKNACFVASFLGIAALMAQLASCSSGNSTPAADSGTGGTGGIGGSGGTAGGTGGTGGTGTGGSGGSSSDSSTDGPTPNGCPTGDTCVPLTANNMGFVSGNDVGVTGAWFAYGDSWGANGPKSATSPGGACEVIGLHPESACSVITAPLFSAAPPEGGLPDGATPPLGFPQTPASSQTFCLSGTAAQVVACLPADTGCTGSDYSSIYGIGIGFDFNNPSGTPLAFNAAAANVVGVQFTITGAAAIVSGGGTGVRVEFPSTTTLTACSGGCEAWNTTVTTDGPTTILFSSLMDTIYPAPDGTPPLSALATTLQAIQFHVPTNTTAAIPVADLCVTGLSVVLGAGGATVDP
jgi:hypothetical protein